ncbi:MAG TPA: 16S rRNA (guanine(966)-N(2))-methyltransferase RsmD [Candidatus Brocadiaceae bacterium]|nr:MAG: 16S rRNA (guanine(966)-N(2))-methyltransferase RsmD [Planctomycetes bacterium RIFCSPHIGHO2_12_42_15]HLE87474.1 16S rRNA (guanine(966)-N(2))-methyltransferase RsmD [Candidatus Brocadiaceae bacterium]
MRVIAGCARGIHLSSLKGDRTRPIQDRTKESLFNILSGVIPGSRVLDMYAGTGSIGIEALSRGATACIFIENDRSATEVIKKNLEVTKLQDKAQVLLYDVFEIIPYLEKNKTEVEIVFASPPYPLVEKGSYRDKLLNLFSLMCSKHIIQPEGLIMLQHRKTDFEIPSESLYLELSDTRTYGDTQFSFFKTIAK